ncbi:MULTISPECIES: GNAT family N-acetyltransferase [Deinococcus]|uniref:GNAT family protein n=1 Tax=Deinococcus rufus TaxID=2136097 RepID=A0ABV7ZGQ7_9DEIO|nr:GNAT family protein [Deinococcus sp. AB2017081]WQE96848.1 GNAT family protein [Deinococcus sp. AB2017081]
MPPSNPTLNPSALTPPAILSTARLRLVPLGPVHLDDTLAVLANRDFMRLTGTHATFTRDQVAAFLHRIGSAADRADWAILHATGGAYVGEAVLNQLDADNLSMNYRITLQASGDVNRGYGTEVTRAVLAYAFDVIGLHRVSLGVYAFNRRARRVYEKCGFIHEGTERHALWWDGAWIDQHRMAILHSDPRS